MEPRAGRPSVIALGLALGGGFLGGGFLGACSSSSDGAPASPLAPGVHDLGLAVQDWRFEGEWIVALSPEGDSDRNGDGDREDLVPVVVHARTGRRHALPWAARQLELEEDVLVLTVPEFAQGGRDLNRDGDALDVVLVVHDLRSGATRNLGLAVGRNGFQALLDLDGPRLAFAVSEPDQGATDLDGDGQALDSVVHWLTLPGGRPVSLALPTRSAPIVSGERVLVRVLERSGDWNGDGDRLDTVLFLHDTRLGTTRNLGRASEASVPGPGLEGDLLAFLVPEGQQGNVDLNGDGNPSGLALEIHELATGASQVPGLSVADFQVGGGLVLFSALEREPAGFSARDLNGDGDLDDRVPFAFDARSVTLIATDLAAPDLGGPAAFAPAPVLAGRRAVFLADERAQGASDLNGDGDAIDLVLHVLDGASGRVAGTAHEVGWGFEIMEAEGDALVFPKPDARDDQLRQAWAHDLGQGTAHPLGNAVVRLQLEEGRALLWVPELVDGVDLDGDGRLGSTVLLVHTLATGQTFNSALAFLPSPPWGKAPVVHGDLLVVDVPEVLQGEDLNGDGDFDDQVLHIVRLP